MLVRDQAHLFVRRRRLPRLAAELVRVAPMWSTAQSKGCAAFGIFDGFESDPTTGGFGFQSVGRLAGLIFR
jgi:hypothetical protein